MVVPTSYVCLLWWSVLCIGHNLCKLFVNISWLHDFQKHLIISTFQFGICQGSLLITVEACPALQSNRAVLLLDAIDVDGQEWKQIGEIDPTEPIYQIML